jgi:hypothetical protein
MIHARGKVKEERGKVQHHGFLLPFLFPLFSLVVRL